MQQKQETNGIQIFSQETSDRLRILQTLADGVISSIKAIETIANKLDGFKAEIHIEKSGDINGNMIGLNNATNAMINNCYMVSGQKDENVKDIVKPDESICIEVEVENSDKEEVEEAKMSCCNDCEHNEKSRSRCGDYSCSTCICDDCGYGCISEDEQFYISDKLRYSKKIDE